jgi:DNA modification methylase
MSDNRSRTVAEKRNYRVLNVEEAKHVALVWLEEIGLEQALEFGLPEVDDRYHVWRVPLVRPGTTERVGEVVIDAYTSLVLEKKTTSQETIEARLLRKKETKSRAKGEPSQYTLSSLRNTIAQGDCERLLEEMAAQSVDLIFTSPPYFNARPEYEDYADYQSYLDKMRRVIRACHHVLNEGRFFVMNISPVLIRRANRGESSRRIAVPFDMHRLFIDEGFDFIDDIIWEKPEGAGWATSRGRRFAADRNPLQYKPVPVTEYVLVYRKMTPHLIDWNIRAYPDQEAVAASKIKDDYERTNIWRVAPANDPHHPAVFPIELAERVIQYYSFKGDVVLDPFAGIGTTGKAAVKLERRFVLIERNPEYVQVIFEEMKSVLGKQAKEVLTINCLPIDTSDLLT